MLLDRRGWCVARGNLCARLSARFSHGSMINDRSAAARGVGIIFYVPIVYILFIYIHIYVLFHTFIIYTYHV